MYFHPDTYEILLFISLSIQPMGQLRVLQIIIYLQLPISLPLYQINVISPYLSCVVRLVAHITNELLSIGDPHLCLCPRDTNTGTLDWSRLKKMEEEKSR